MAEMGMGYVKMAYKTMRRSAKVKDLFLLQMTKNKDRQVCFFNFEDAPYTSSWLYRFVKNSHLLDNTKKKIAFCSVFGDRAVLDNVFSDVKVFFSGENLYHRHYASYADRLLGDPNCNLSLGFDYFEDVRYLRFPFWLIVCFEPVADANLIAERCRRLRYPNLDTFERKGFASLIARVDTLGYRTEMYNKLSALGRIDCPSKVNHNDDSLATIFKDDKLAYLKNYTFNICPENSNAWGYVTEKVFQAIGAGCIPIYWGSYNDPEPKVLNRDAVVLWDRNDGGTSAMRLVSDLLSNTNRLHDFMAQPRLLPTAEEQVENMILGLRDKLKELIEQA